MLIAINGRKQSGKDTVGKIIEYLTNESNVYPFDLKIDYSHRSDWQIKKFADKLKDIVCLLINCTREQLEDESIKSKELGEEWWYWYMERDGGYSPIILDYLTTTKKELKNYEGLELIKPTIRFLLQFIGTDLLRNQLHPQIWVNTLFADVDRKISIEEEKRLKSIWKNINTRCTNSNYEKFHRYGGIGIINEFKDFNDFVNWSLLNGYTNKLTLDRKDGKSNYNKFNCRWVTVDLQSFNKLKYTNSKSNYKGVSKTKVNDKNSYIAQIQFKGKKENLGYFKTEEEAKVAYDKRYLEILKILEEENSQKLYKYKNIIITDMRFVNEMDAIKKRGGITIRVNRPCEICGGSGYHKMSCPVSKSGEHLSETSLDKAEFDYVIENSGSIEELIEKVKEIFIKEKLL